jgi:hypothetical protein
MTGCVMPNMQWIGYVNDAADALSTTKPYVSYSLDDARKSGKKYAMVNIAEFQCPGCKQSADEIAAGGAAVVQAGGVVIEVLMTSGFSAIAPKSDLDSWVQNHMLNVTSVKDPDGSMGTPTYDQMGLRDQAYIIDLSTMSVIQCVTGSIFSNPGNNSGGLGLTAMHTLLGK